MVSEWLGPRETGVEESTSAEANSGPTSIELFTGGGGIALGVHLAGFEHLLLAELDPKACETVRENNRRGVLQPPWPIREVNIRSVDLRAWQNHVHLLAAGAPCQPFSLGGLHQGAKDHRNLFDEVVRAVREVQPLAFLLENVRGLVRPSFFPYFEYVLWQLERPEIAARKSESWRDHKVRLGKSRTPPTDGISYKVDYRVLNAADYGVPQRRERVVVVGVRDDVSTPWTWPEPTHSGEALAYAKWVDASYWAEHGLPPRHVPAEMMSRVERLRQVGKPRHERRRTVRDALSGLSPPAEGHDHPHVLNHRAIPGARRYKGHDGSSLDEPAKTLKAGVHGVPGGEGTILLDDGAVRYLSVREAARIQTFPDNYFFFGSRTHAMRQIGNAVPVRLAEALALQVRGTLVPPG